MHVVVHEMYSESMYFASELAGHCMRHTRMLVKRDGHMAMLAVMGASALTISLKLTEIHMDLEMSSDVTWLASMQA